MLAKRLFTQGTLGLALAASLFIGCQDFLGEEKGPAATPTSSSDDILHAAKEVSSQDSVASQTVATVDTAKPADMPAKATDPAPTTAAAIFDSLQACVDIYTQMQKAGEPLYGELKNKYVGLGCINIIGTAGPDVLPPVPPLDAAIKCKMFQANLASGSYQNAKYPITQATVDSVCAEVTAAQPTQPAQPAVTEPAKPAETTKATDMPAKVPDPAPTTAAAIFDSVQACVDIYTQMQTSKDPLYGEFKNKYSAMNCNNVIVAAGPGVLPPVPPLDTATKCKMYRSNLATMTGTEEPKYLDYMKSMAVVCAAYP
ncbi:MAG: hypothetical protein ABI036_13455 [Fibrobacteria bacterium]